MKFSLMRICCLLSLAAVFGFSQGYVTPGLVPLPTVSNRRYKANYHDFNIKYIKPRPEKADIDVTGGVYKLSYEFHMGNNKKNDWMIGGSYTGGDIDIDPSKASLRSRIGVFGEWYFDKGMSIFAESQFGEYSENGPDYSFSDNCIGLRFAVEGNTMGGSLQGPGTAGIFYNLGEFEDAGGTTDFWGAEIIAMEAKNHSWLKWYYGEVGGKSLITTDFLFPFYEDPAYGMAYCLRYVSVNSQTDSVGTPHLLAYGSRLGDWTKHEEWWLQVSFGLGSSASDWSGYVGYGIYRSPVIPGQNDSVLMILSLSYTY